MKNLYLKLSSSHHASVKGIWKKTEWKKGKCAGQCVSTWYTNVWEEKVSTKQMPPSDWRANPQDIVLIGDWRGRAQPITSSDTTRQVLYKKQGEEAMENKQCSPMVSASSIPAWNPYIDFPLS